MGFVAVHEFNHFKIDVFRIWRFHTDRGGEFFKHMDQCLNEDSIWQSTTIGYDLQANGMAQACVGVMARGCQSLLHQAGAPRALWRDAITFINEARSVTKRNIDDTLV